MKKLLLFLTLSLLLTACNININLGQNSDPNSTIAPEASATPLPTLAPTASPTPTPVSIEDQLKTIFATKYSKPIADITLEVNDNTGTHATGLIKFAGEISGGMWLAHLDGTDWVLDFDGNGTPYCANIQPHNYPTSIIAECWDDVNNQLVQL